MNIKTLFDQNKNIYRTIEKVITYSASQEDRLKAEISEYVVTESIEEKFESLLSKMQLAMENGGEKEVGVWVSGFYGSGKSSFTKYLGLAFDDNIKIDGVLFREHLQNRLKKATTKALLNTVARKFPAAVLLLDLASEQVAGSTMEEVSTVLYYKVLQWAGYSRNLKVAAFERMLKKDVRFDEFLELFKSHTDGQSWDQYRDNELIVDSLIPEIAHKMYPALFVTSNSFSTESSGIIRFENDRVSEMLEIAREATGKEYIIFIIDEVGQYVGSRPNLILNLDGLAKNLKSIGDGKVWIIGTAQQTLTEDDPKASLNSPELYKLKDRFPLGIDLEANDIKEICYRRLLAKSPSGDGELGKSFDDHGPKLRQNTKLEDARVYGADFDRTDFINLYPFLPAHFDILLHLLGALAKSTGGIGLRSAIKVIQDMLVDSSNNVTPVADRPIGWLATTDTMYDSLEKDIQRSFPQWHRAVEKVKIRFPASPTHNRVSKTVCVLQILGNLPIVLKNISSLMHQGVTDESAFEEVKKAVEDLTRDSIVPFGEQDGQLRFFSEKLNDIELERSTILLRSIDIKKIQNEALTETYSPLPRVQLSGSYAVQTGLKAQTMSGFPTSLSGDRNHVQTLVELLDASEYENSKIRLTDESRDKSSRNTIFLLGRTSLEMEEITQEIHRCREIASKYRSEPDQEVKEYCKGQIERSARLLEDLKRLLTRSLLQGSFIFRGEVTAVESLAQDLHEAAQKQLSNVAERVFDRYSEAPVRAGTDLAEKLLRVGNLNGVTAAIDPLSLVQIQAGTPFINTNYIAIVSIKDMIDRQGSLDGKRLTEIFTDAPFGWSPDTLRYLIAAMLLAGEIKLKVAAREIMVNGQQAIDGLKTNNTFKAVGISLRDEKPSNEILARAAERLTSLAAENVLPLEDEISKVTMKLFPQLQHDYAPLAEKLKSLNLPGSDRLISLSDDIKNILYGDASDAPQRLGSKESALSDDLFWAAELKQALSQGLEDVLKVLLHDLAEIERLPASGIPGKLKGDLVEGMLALNERLSRPDFFRYTTEYSSALTDIQARIRGAVDELQNQQNARIRSGEEEVVHISEWKELTLGEQDSQLAIIEGLALSATDDLSGLTLLVNQEFNIHQALQDCKEAVKRIGQERLKDKASEAQKIGKGKSEIKLESQKRMTSLGELDALISQLQQIRQELEYAIEFEITLDLLEGKGE